MTSGVFLAAAATSLAASWLLVSRLARVGARLGLSEALLGMVAALAADAPEITTAVAALLRHEHSVGTGVVMGSNVFNLAALLGLSAVIAGEIGLHRRVIVLSGTVAVWVAVVSLVVIVGVLSPPLGLLAVAVALLPYLVILGASRDRLLRTRLPRAVTRWLAAAVREEERELEVALHPRRGRGRDAVEAAAATVVVVGASVVMERAATRVGSDARVPPIVIGGIVLAAVTSLPNAVSAVYFAAQQRGTAVLSTALNSNAINVAAGFLLPAALLGLGTSSGQEIFVGAFYPALTAVALVCAYAAWGLRRGAGVLIIACYLAYLITLVTSA